MMNEEYTQEQGNKNDYALGVLHALILIRSLRHDSFEDLMLEKCNEKIDLCIQENEEIVSLIKDIDQFWYDLIQAEQKIDLIDFIVTG